ncbi:class II aldolase/adducin N-terminal [Limtongia smithiae]|uniref:class II aldolase/adducin N-terminal n=1 Tax=Limtongia smithiae TaxID=1125753 RepID=UPI0034CE9726
MVEERITYTEEEAEALVHSRDNEHPANLICELCRLFYSNGWVTGTGGGISVRKDDLVYLAPTGVQKERMQPDNMFVMNLPTKEYIRRPKTLGVSACTPLFLEIYDQRDAGACIHTHSQNAVLATLLYDDAFEIANIEQIKALPRITTQGNMGFYDTLRIPIIENTAHEEDLHDALAAAMRASPGTTAVLVRRHGIYVWGESVWKAKVYNEALDYLLELGVRMRQLGLDPAGEVGSEKKARR